jgi:riboflavin synthase
MFTGIVSAVSSVKKNARAGSSLVLTLAVPRGWKFGSGDSVAVNGACLTIERISAGFFTVSLMPETLKKTVFGSMIPVEVNLERPLVLGGYLGGHLVQGHIDAVGAVEAIKKIGDSREVTVSFPSKFSRLVVQKGSIAVDGVSLTVAEAKADNFSVALIDYTLKHTTLGGLKIGSRVNLEFDIIGKYVDRMLSFSALKKINF